jgi:predicted RNA-binding protein (virulence factor B family)
MVKIGKWNNLQITKELTFGVYLDGEESGEILLPKKYIQNEVQTGDFIDVFVYYDSEDRIIATTQKPFGEVGEFAFLKVIDANSTGAFLNWGLPKDLFVPFREQKGKMQKGESYLVYIYYDEASRRIAASARISKFLNDGGIPYLKDEEVNFIVYKETEIGYKILIENQFLGMIFKNEIFEKIRLGQKMKGFVKEVRNDDKIDVSLNNSGYNKIDFSSKQILDLLKKRNGSLPLSDKSSPEIISKYLGMSKKTFKKSIGNLYKNHLIKINENDIELIENDGL